MLKLHNYLVPSTKAHDDVTSMVVVLAALVVLSIRRKPQNEVYDPRFTRFS